MSRRAASNLAAVKMDLAGATVEGDEDRITLLETLLSCGGRDPALPAPAPALCRALRRPRRGRHVAVVVPGVGDGTNMCHDWIPDAINLYGPATDGGRPVEGLRQPGRHPGCGGRVDRVQRRPGDCRHDLMEFVDQARPGSEAVADRGGAQFRLGGDRRRAGRCRVAVHRRRRGGQPRHDGRRAAPAAPRAVPLLLRAGAGRRHRRTGHLRGGAGVTAVRGHAHAHERARPSAGGGALALLRAGLRGAGEHGRRGHRSVRRHRAPPGRLARDRRRPGRLGAAPARRAGAGGRAATTGAPASGSWSTGAASSTSGRARRATWSARCSTRASGPCCGSPTGSVRCSTRPSACRIPMPTRRPPRATPNPADAGPA